MKKLFNYLFAVPALSVSDRRAIIKRQYERYGYKPISVINYHRPAEIADKLQQLMKPLTFNNA